MFLQKKKSKFTLIHVPLFIIVLLHYFTQDCFAKVTKAVPAMKKTNIFFYFFRRNYAYLCNLLVHHEWEEDMDFFFTHKRLYCLLKSITHFKSLFIDLFLDFVI